VATAKAAGLRYVTDAAPGIRRQRFGRGFRYLDPAGAPVTDSDVLRRIRSMAIPPAWMEVWIATSANAHIQATGRDSRGRKQYIYHPEWRRIRDETKYHRMLVFGAALPDIRARVNADAGRPGMSRERVLATIVRLLDETAIRVGNSEYMVANGSFGLTTLRTEHVDVRGSTLRFHFRGKGGKDISLSIKDRRVAATIRRLQELPGQDIFRYRSGDGALIALDSSDVNLYIREVSGQDFTAKDFRTWTAGVLVAEALAAMGSVESDRQRTRNVNAAVEYAAKRLGNTKTVCRASYVHPDIIRAYEEGWLPAAWVSGYQAQAPDGLHPEENAMLSILVQAETGRTARPG